MKKETQDRLWAILSKNEREELRKAYATPAQSHYSEGYDNARDCYFGHHNLTSDEEPSELLFVERKKAQEYRAEADYACAGTFSSEYSKGYWRGQQTALDRLFGDKCLPDKEPSVQVEPKFNVGDKVYCKNIGRVLIVVRIITKYQKYELYDEHGYGCGFWEWNSPNLEPYTEPETKDNNNMEEKELNLCELLKGCEGEEFYTLVYGEVYLRKINPNKDFPISIRTPSGLLTFLTKDGKCYNKRTVECIFFPSRALYEKYPLDAYSAWMEWKSDRTPKRWRAKEEGRYWCIGFELQVCPAIEYSTEVDTNRYKCGNYFRTKEEAQQAAEAVRECLMKFHEQKQALF